MKEENISLNEEDKRKVVVVRAIDQINEVQKEPKPNLIWKGIPEGSTGLITGVAKTGKTTFAENLAISIAIGKKSFFNGTLSGVPKKVLFVNLEESYRLRGWRNAKQISKLTTKEVELFTENYLTIPKDFPQFLNTEDDWDYLQNYIVKSEAEVVFIDSLTHMCIGEIERSSVAQQFVQKFKSNISSLGKTVIVIHHNIKGNERPIDQDSIAGSRVILQTFEYAYGFANIPTGGNYACMLNNKHVPKDDTTAVLYKVNEDGWVEYLESKNKFNLYNKPLKSDGRVDSTNPDLIYKYIQSQGSQGSLVVTTDKLMSEFVQNNTRVMSKDTLFKSLNKLEINGKIKKQGKGKYINNEVGNGERK